MIILHEYKLIFLKTRKTAGTSIEHFLGRHRGPDDIVTRVYPPLKGHEPQNHRGLFNPIGDSRVVFGPDRRFRTAVRIALNREKFFNHMTAGDLRRRISATVWDGYTKIAVERNPWDKVASMHNMMHGAGNTNVTIDDVIESTLVFNHPIYTDAKTGRPCVDYLIRYERLAEELGQVLRYIGLPFNGDLGVRAKSDAKPADPTHRDDLSQSQIDRIGARFALEIEIMRYDFAEIRQ